MFTAIFFALTFTYPDQISPTQFMETINAINEMLIDAHSLRWSFFDNALAYFTLYISRLFVESHYDKVSALHARFITSV